MNGLQVIAAQLPNLLALLFVLGSIFWGRQVVKAKDEQIKARDATIALLERLEPTRMLEQLEAIRGIYQERARVIEEQATAEQEALRLRGTVSADQLDDLRNKLAASRGELDMVKARLAATKEASRAVRALREVQELETVPQRIARLEAELMEFRRFLKSEAAMTAAEEADLKHRASEIETQLMYSRAQLERMNKRSGRGASYPG